MIDLEKYCKTSFKRYNLLLFVGNAIIFVCAAITFVLSILNIYGYIIDDNYNIGTLISPPISLIVSIPLIFFSIYNILFTKKIRLDICSEKTGYSPGLFS